MSHDAQPSSHELPPPRETTASSSRALLSERRIPPWVLVVVGILVVAVAVPLVILPMLRTEHTLLLTTGDGGGTYYPLGHGLAKAVGGRSPEITIEVEQSSGAVENMRRLLNGKAQMALVQNDTPGGPGVRAIAPLYHEVLHVLARKDANVHSLLDMRGKRVSLGPSGSGTLYLVNRLFSHYAVSHDDFHPHEAGSSEAADMLIRNELDVMFFLSGIKSPACQKAVDSGLVEFVSLGDASSGEGGQVQGFRYSYPFVEPFTIPIYTYSSEHGGQPEVPVATLAVRAVLVAHQDAPNDVIHDVTEALFQNRVELVAAHTSANEINEHFDAALLQFPLHEGAQAYYRRDEPSFLVTYAETMAFLLSAGIAIAGLALGFQKWLHRRKKNRIDVYYLRLDQIFIELRKAALSADQIDNLLEELVVMRRRAFQQLVDEELLADDSFRIFQDYWSECRSSLEALTTG